jgi:pyridoxal phosphate enzyme (YggS family)
MTAETATATEALRARLEGLRRRIDEAAGRAGRDPSEVTLVAVSKTQPAALVRAAAEAGATDFGENRVQEAEAKIEGLAGSGVRWHLIGHLQSNKARRAVKLFDLIHTVDTAELVDRLERLCVEETRPRLDVLVQIDLAGEATKSGARAAELPAVAAALGACRRVRCVGLMTLPPFFEEVERVRPYFRRLRELRDEWRGRGLFGEAAGQLSMGMSHDFEAAVEEGATFVRVGTALFGERGGKQ